MLSYISSPSKDPFTYETMTGCLRRFAEQNPNRDAIVYYGLDMKRRSLSRLELLESAESLAGQFVQMGVKKGDKIGFCMNNSLNMVIANVAIMFAGGVPFYTGTQLKDGSDIAERIDMMESKFFIVDADEGDTNWTIAQNILASCKLNLCVIYNGKSSAPFKDMICLEDIMKRPRVSVNFPDIYPEDFLLFFSSSGSTGTPKQIAHTHFNVMNWTTIVCKAFGMSEESIYFNDRPISWAVGNLRTMLTMGITRIIVDPQMTFSGQYVEQICRIIQEERCNYVYVPGYIAQDLISIPNLHQGFKAVDVMICGGERVPKRFAYLIGSFCRTLFVLYGCTELGGVASFASQNPEKFVDGIAGTPHDGIEIKIVDENGDTVKRGASGEFLVRSICRFVGYYKLPDLFEKVVDRAGWFHTGDIAHIRDDGNIVMDGRQSEVVSIGTIKFFLWEVEKVLLKCPGVKAAFAVGVPDLRFHQVVCAVIIPINQSLITEDDVKKFCNDQFVEVSTAMGVSIKPRYVIFIDKIPRLMSGKIVILGAGAVGNTSIAIRYTMESFVEGL
ncbi:hypothetical protein CHS0354_011726 [Potamilus streckersoni]|uniref:Uncharacterized protein n=1 Tax=Potamilus streckersoni TaxID=2493646 RepID=A0AAE0SJ41_9BIVA|nr:hypothetical protein CHS0354_011726 [Potamilus streckersoni]